MPVRVMLPIDASLLTRILVGMAVAGIIRGGARMQDKSHAPLLTYSYSLAPIGASLNQYPLHFLFPTLAAAAAVHFNLISDHQSSPRLKLTRFARECLGLPISLHIRPKKCRRSRRLSDASEPVKLEKPLDGRTDGRGRTEWISVVM